MACGDVLSLEDLQTAKKHQIFEAEVITGKVGGVAGGASIDYATNQITGQTQKTLPAVIRDTGFRPATFTFTTGGTLAVGDSDAAVLWPIADGGDGQYYLWKGSYPKIIPAGSTPASTGGVSSSGWMPMGDITVRPDWDGFTAVLLSQAGMIDNGLPDTPVYSKRVEAINRIILKSTYNLNLLSPFTVGLTFTSFSDVSLYGGMYYMPYGNVTFPLVVTSATPDPLVFKCCGELKGYPINDIRNFGAKPYPAYSHDAINLAIKFINPYVWRGSIADTYTNGPCGDGTVIVPEGWWRCGDKILHNPGVRLKGVSPARRIYGRKTPKNSLLGSVIFGDSATFKPTYLIDTANYKNDGTRLYASSDFITAVNVDVDGLYAASEGSMLEDLYIIHGQGFFGGFRQHWAMRGGYRNVAVSGFKCNASCNQMWNQITNGLWSEESDIPLMIAETTTQVFDGPHTLLGRGPTAPVDYSGFPLFLSGMVEDGNTLATGQKLASRCLFVAYCEHPVFTALVTEYAVNPILVRDTRCLTLNNYHEEANGTVGWTGYKSVVAGWASKVEVKGATSLSNIPFFAMGSGSKGSLTDTVQQNGASQSNTGFASTPMQLTLDTDVLPLEIIRGGEVIFLRNKPTIYAKIDGNASVYGHNISQPTTIDSALKHLSTSGIIDANIVLTGEVIRNAGGFGVFGALSISGAFAFTHAASAPAFTLSAKSISKQGISEYMNSVGFILEGRHTDITHKNTLTTGSFSAYSTAAAAHTVRFVSENANVGTTIFNNSTGKISISGASLSGGITAGNLVTTPANAALNFVY